MGTTDTRVNLSRNRILGRQDLDERFLGYVRGLVLEGIKNTFLVDTVFQTPLTLAADGDDKFKITGGAIATDGDGHMLNIAASGFANAIQFENTLDQDYDVGLRFADPFKGIQINPRNGLNEYVEVEEVIGDSADPDSVVDNGNSTITLIVDSVTEAGVTNAGRVVRVFLKVPAKLATTEAVAIEDLVVVFVGGLNKITTTGDLGQPTISTTAADYTVVLLGPTVRRNEDLQAAADTVFVGEVTGAGLGSPPASFNTGGQRVFDFSFGDMGDITRREVITARLKIDVKSFAGDEGTNQIQVQDPSLGIVFSVDGTGKVGVNRLLFAPVGGDIVVDVVTSTALTAATGTSVTGVRAVVTTGHTSGTLSDAIGFSSSMVHNGAGILTDLTGLLVNTANLGGGTIGTITGVLINAIGSTGITDSVGVDIFDITNATNNFAIRTRLGTVQFGDKTDVARTFDPTGGDHTLQALAITTTATGGGGAAQLLGIDVQSTSIHADGTIGTVAGLKAKGLHNSAGTGIVTRLVGIESQVQRIGSGTVTEMIGVDIFSLSGSATIAIGIDISDVTNGSSNFAIRTGFGIVEFGDDVVAVADVIPNLTLTSDLGTNILKWNEGHTRFLSIGSAAGVTFPDEDKALQVGIEDVTPTVTANAIRSFVTTSTADPLGTTILGIDSFVTANHSTGTLALAQAALFSAVNAGAGTVTTLRGIQILVSGTGPVGTAVGIEIGSVTAGTTNFAFRTSAGLVQFGDIVEFTDVAQPDALGVDLGATGDNRWQNVKCEQVRASLQPAGAVFRDAPQITMTDEYVDVDLDSAADIASGGGAVQGGMSVSATGVFTVPSNGLYLVTYNIPIGDLSPPATTPSRVQAKCVIDQGGTPVQIPQSHSQSSYESGTSRPGLSASFLVKINAGFDIRIRIRHVATSGSMSNFANYPDTDTEGTPAESVSASFNILAVAIF